MKTKSIALFIISIFATTLLSAIPPKAAKLTVNWSFVGIIDGYDHDSKCIVYVDGKEVGESTVTHQSVPNSITVDVKKGKHIIKVQNFAHYEDRWEEHTKANNYSVDCTYIAELQFKKQLLLFLTLIKKL